MEPRRKAGQPGSAESRRPAGAPKEPTSPAGAPKGDVNPQPRPTRNPAEPDAEASEEQGQSFESERARAEDSAGSDSEDSAGGDPEDSAGLVQADLDELLAETKRERDEYLELARRTKADFENYRRRAARDTQDAERRGKCALARDLVPALDNLERALRASGIDPEAAGDDANAEDGGGLVHGVRLTYHDLRATLERAGVESYDPKGERFDPTWHEALATRAEEGTEAGIVLETVEKGYRLDGQVLRPARVVVSE
jgi:molecular chaperone GrpE